VAHDGGTPLETIQPGQVAELVSVTPYSTYARWSKIIITDDKPKLTLREGWKEPSHGLWEIEMLNVDGKPLEARQVDGAAVFLPRGIPVIVGINSLSEPLIWYSRLEVRWKLRRVKHPHFPNYYSRERYVGDELTLRSEKELKAIEAEMGEAAKHIEDFKRPEKRANDNPEPEYICELVNERETPARMFHDNGSWMFDVLVKGKSQLAMYSATAMYSQFSKITFKEGGKIEVEKNKRWKSPWGDSLLVELDNRHGCPTEAIEISHNGEMQTCNAPKSLPLRYPIDISDPNAIYERISWELVPFEQAHPAHPHYKVRGVKQEIVKTPRPEKAIREIFEARNKTVDDDATKRKDELFKQSDRQSGGLLSRIFGI
jgi:hypothetical protein